MLFLAQVRKICLNGPDNLEIVEASLFDDIPITWTHLHPEEAPDELLGRLRPFLG